MGAKMRMTLHGSILVCAAILNLLTISLAGQRAENFSEQEFRSPKAMNLAAVHENNRLGEISQDGSLLVLYQTAAQTRRLFPNRQYSRDDLLRVVDLQSGREVAHIETEFFPSSIRFIPNSPNVFYIEPENPSRYVLKIWNYGAGKSARCSDENAFGLSNVTFLNESTAVAALLDEANQRALLAEIRLPDCSMKVIGPADPSDPKRYRVFGPLSVSPDGKHVAYKVPAANLERIIVREVATGKTVTDIEPNGLYLSPKILYTNDQIFLIVVAASTGVSTQQTKRYLLFYDAKTYELKRQLEVTSWDRPESKTAGPDVVISLGTTWAVSPDSRLIAVGNRTADGRQPYIVLYDLATGRELCRASYPPVSPRRDDPFLGMISSLAFTPDGKTLVSSTYDTRIWRLQ
jgi:WD40 repeat protein